MIPLILALVLIPLVISLLILGIRFLLGPTNLDRVVVFESITLVTICLAALIGIHLQTEWLYDAILVLSLIGFFSTVALSIHLAKRRMTEWSS